MEWDRNGLRTAAGILASMRENDVAEADRRHLEEKKKLAALRAAQNDGTMSTSQLLAKMAADEEKRLEEEEKQPFEVDSPGVPSTQPDAPRVGRFPPPPMRGAK